MTVRGRALNWWLVGAVVALTLALVAAGSLLLNRAMGVQTASARAEVDPYLSQSVDWEKCPKANKDQYLSRLQNTPKLPKSLQCATVRVPVDHFNENSGRGDMSISLVRVPAKGERVGDLLVNPGGPGGSGWEYAALNAKEFRNRFPGYDVIGFDPRGVQRSEEVTCGKSEQQRLQDLIQDPTPETRREYLRFYDQWRADFQDCLANYPNWGFLGTKSVVHDMFLINQILGNDKLNYYGVSYGSEIGYTYLEEFGDNVDRMIIESPVDRVAVESTDPEQMGAFEKRIDKLVVKCAKVYSCGQGRDVPQTREAVKKALGELEQSGWTRHTPSPDGSASPAMVYAGMIAPLYWDWTKQAQAKYTKWYLEALSGLINDRVAGRFEWWGFHQRGYDPDSDRFTEGESVTGWVRCLDSADDDVQIIESDSKEYKDKLRKVAPYWKATFDDVRHYEDDNYEPCWIAAEAWNDPLVPDPVRGTPEQVSNPNHVPVLLLGVSGDTATPIQWARNVAEAMELPLVTQKIDAHGAYLRASTKCSRAVVTRYLHTRELPTEDVTCRP